jgi:putative Mn2+ efflux pump MntP
MVDLPRSIKWSTSVYRLLLMFYPASFRKEFGDEMVIVFHEQATDAWSRNGWLGLASVWYRILSDLFKSVPDQYVSIGLRMIFFRSASPMNYKSFRISIGNPKQDVNWTLWRIIAVVAVSFLVLIVGVRAFVETQTLFLTAVIPYTSVLIASIAGLIVDVCIVWMGAKMISRFVAPSSNAALLEEHQID